MHHSIKLSSQSKSLEFLCTMAEKNNHSWNGDIQGDDNKTKRITAIMQVRCCVLSREIEMLFWAGNDKFIEAQTVKLKSLFNLNKAFFIRKRSHFVWFMFILSHCKCFCVFKWKVVFNAENTRSSLVPSRFEEIKEFLHAFYGISKRNESIVWLRAVSINLSVLLTLWSRGVCDARMTIFFQNIFVWLLCVFFFRE